jgi:hypothetical protein
MERGIRLISEAEEFAFAWGSSTIYYRRVPSHIQQMYEQRNTVRGIVDQRAVLDDVFRYAILRWDGVTDDHGVPVPFESKYVSALPEEVRADLIRDLYAGNPLAASLGNSSNGSTPIPS